MLEIVEKKKYFNISTLEIVPKHKYFSISLTKNCKTHGDSIQQSIH